MTAFKQFIQTGSVFHDLYWMGSGNLFVRLPDWEMFFPPGKKAVWAAWNFWQHYQASQVLKFLFEFHLFMSFTPVLFYVLLSAFKAPCVYTLRTYLLTYTGEKKSACQKIGSAASSSYYTSMLLPANLIGQPQASLPPARPSSPRLNIQARERTTVAFQ